MRPPRRAARYRHLGRRSSPSIVSSGGLVLVRKQYHFQPGIHRLDAWDVHRLVELAERLPVKTVPLDVIWELDEPYWSQPQTPRKIAQHFRQVKDVDPSYPIILGADGRVMDGMHRVLRAILDGRSTIEAVQFDKDPEPDFLDVEKDELPYADTDA